MALFHSTTKIITRSDGGNAVAAAAYRSGTRMTCQRTGQVFNYTRKKEVTYRAILAPANSPAWVFDRAMLANAVEAIETRANSQLWREVELALPIQLTPAQHIQLLNEYVQEQFVGIGMVVHICLHDKKTDRGGNPHAHILLTLRDITPDGFGAKRRDWNDKALVVKWREAWATACNDALAKAGSTERIDHRSNMERGIAAPATKHLGRRNPWNSEHYDNKAAANAWIQTSIELAKIQSQIRRIDTQLIDITTSIAQALAERDSRKTRDVTRSTKPVPTTARTPQVWTPSSDLRIAPVSAASLLRRSNPNQSKRPNLQLLTPPSGTHDQAATTKETPTC